MFLAGDIGGTKSSLGLFDANGQMLHCSQYKNSECTSPESLLERFIAQHKQCQPQLHDTHPIQGMCLGIAGPVHEQTCQMTNLSWYFDANALSAL